MRHSQYVPEPTAHSASARFTNSLPVRTPLRSCGLPSSCSRLALTTTGAEFASRSSALAASPVYPTTFAASVGWKLLAELPANGEPACEPAKYAAIEAAVGQSRTQYSTEGS